MVVIYPAVIHDDPDGLWADFPDLDGCQSQGDSLEEILVNSAEALECYALGLLENGQKLPAPSSPTSIVTEDGSFVTLIKADVDLAKNTRSVKKTLTIPSWLNDRAVANGVNFSSVLQNALLAQLGIL